MVPVARAACVRSILAALFAAAAATACAVDPSGGSSALSREELLRKWDLNSDGKIDEGEAEIARARNRRKRTEMLANPDLDPLTGRLKTPETGEQPSRQPEPLPEPDPRARPKRERPGLPGTQAPLPRSAADGTTGPPAVGRDAPPNGAAAAPDAALAPRRSTARTRPSWSRGTPLMGGARAGAPAARGYGSGIAPLDLNAGRLYGGLPGARSRPPAASGGLLPEPRPPAAPVAPRPPRTTVDDFGPY